MMHTPPEANGSIFSAGRPVSGKYLGELCTELADMYAPGCTDFAGTDVPTLGHYQPTVFHPDNYADNPAVGMATSASLPEPRKSPSLQQVRDSIKGLLPEVDRAEAITFSDAYVESNEAGNTVVSLVPNPADAQRLWRQQRDVGYLLRGLVDDPRQRGHGAGVKPAKTVNVPLGRNSFQRQV